MPPDDRTGGLRLFVALELPSDWRQALADLQRDQERAAPGYFRWVRPELLHLTLVFLGSQPAERLDDLAALLGRAAADVPRFLLRLGRVGTFGPQRAPRVLWVEAHQPAGRLQQLRRSLDHELQTAAVSYDAKPLVPHVTLGRARPAPSQSPRLTSARLPSTEHFVERVVLFESQLSSRGPSYLVRADAPLAGLGDGRGPRA